MTIQYPPGCDTPELQILYVLRSMEALKLTHNTMGKMLTGEVTQEEYDNGKDAGELNGKAGEVVPLTEQIKTDYPFKGQITQAEFDGFKEGYFRTRQTLLATEQARLRAELGYDKTFPLDLDNLEVK